MKATLTCSIVILVLFSLIACTAGHNQMVDSVDRVGDIAGFWQGLWHGFIVLFSFLWSLFSDNVSVYEIHNNGGWYNFGFVLGVMFFFGGSSGGGCQASKRKRR